MLQGNGNFGARRLGEGWLAALREQKGYGKVGGKLSWNTLNHYQSRNRFTSLPFQQLLARSWKGRRRRCFVLSNSLITRSRTNSGSPAANWWARCLNLPWKVPVLERNWEISGNHPKWQNHISQATFGLWNFKYPFFKTMQHHFGCFFLEPVWFRVSSLMGPFSRSSQKPLEIHRRFIIAWFTLRELKVFWEHVWGAGPAVWI